MCVTPCIVPEVGPVACRNCWQCAKDRVNDLVGRCIAESYTSSLTRAVTLTYRGDVVNAAVLVYRDVQLMLKRLRYAGYKVRYICAGEYGSKKGRAHWHLILFFQGKYPEIETDKRIEWEYWPEGFSYFQEPDYGAFQYVLKYVLKDQSQQVARKHLAMSKKPPLGYDYFMNDVERYVRAKLSPQTPEYQFRGVYDGKGKLRTFRLQGRMREILIETFLERYKDVHRVDPPYSEFVEEHEDKVIRAENYLDEEKFSKQVEENRYYTNLQRIYDQAQEETEPEPPTVIQYVVFPEEQQLELLVMSDGTFQLFHNGEKVWESLVTASGSAAKLGKALSSRGLSRHEVLKALSLLSDRGLFVHRNPQNIRLEAQAKGRQTLESLPAQNHPTQKRRVLKM